MDWSHRGPHGHSLGIQGTCNVPRLMAVIGTLHRSRYCIDSAAQPVFLVSWHHTGGSGSKVRQVDPRRRVCCVIVRRTNRAAGHAQGRGAAPSPAEVGRSTAAVQIQVVQYSCSTDAVQMDAQLQRRGMLVCRFDCSAVTLD